MNYATEFDSSFDFWGGALSRVEIIINAFGYDGVEELCDFVTRYFEGYGELPTATEINDFVQFDVSCFETCYGAPECGCELVFTLDPDETAEELAGDIEMGYARQLF